MRLKLGGIAFAAALLATTSAHAGVYADDLSKCFSASVTADDRKVMVQFMFLSLAQHPDVAAYSTIPPQERESIGKKRQQLMTRLLTVDCRKQAIAVVKHEGDAPMWGAFSVLGELTFGDMFDAPEVRQASGGSDFFDTAAVGELLKEAETGSK
jgi:hypothetical protein